MTVAQHSGKSDQWGTPAEIIDCARDVLGGITFDPCSSELANERVAASRWSDNGLMAQWACERMLINPPGGRGLPKAFWTKLMLEPRAEAIFVCFTLEQLATLQTPEGGPLDFPICVPRKRLKFYPLAGQKATSPAHGNAIVYVGPEVDYFVAVFSRFGQCSVPAHKNCLARAV